MKGIGLGLGLASKTILKQKGICQINKRDRVRVRFGQQNDFETKKNLLTLMKGIGLGLGLASKTILKQKRICLH